MTDEIEGPKPTGRLPQDVTLTGALLPMHGDEPILLEMPGSPYLYLAVFSTTEKLACACADWPTVYGDVDRIVVVTDAHDFIESTSQLLTVILDPWLNPENGRCRFLQIKGPAVVEVEEAVGEES